MAPHVVIAHRLSALDVRGLTGVTRDERAFYPVFDPDTLHYAARCTESVTLSLQTENEGTRLSVNGEQRPKDEAFTLDGLGRESDIRIMLTGTQGASTTYTVHCIDRTEFPKLTTVKADGATEDLMMFRAKWRPSGVSRRSSLIIMDNNGVPRWRKHIADNVNEYFRVFPDETHPRARYGYMKQGSSYNTDGVELVVLDKYFNTVDEDIHILSPFNNTDGHDQIILPNGDYVLMAYSRGQRDLSFLNTAFPDLRNDEGDPLGTNEAVRDSAIQVRTSDGTVKFNWNAWDHMAIEDCIRGSMFNVEYAHINSLGLIERGHHRGVPVLLEDPAHRRGHRQCGVAHGPLRSQPGAMEGRRDGAAGSGAGAARLRQRSQGRVQRPARRAYDAARESARVRQRHLLRIAAGSSGGRERTDAML